MITHKFIDYLEFNAPKDVTLPVEGAKSIKAYGNYRHGYELSNGLRVYSGHNKSDKLKVIASGVTMLTLRQDRDDRQILADVLNTNCDINRLDMAMDMYISDDLITPSEFNQWYYDNKIISSHLGTVDKPYAPRLNVELAPSGIQYQTINFGDKNKRGDKGMVRVYDKGIELNLSEFMITRVEVEDKRRKAHVSAQRIADGAPIGSVMCTRFDVTDERYQGAIDSPSLDITRGTGRAKVASDDASSRWQWLIENVAPAYGRALAHDAISENFNSGNSQLFNDAVIKAYNDYLLDNS